jgi:hypothetical protein
MVIFKIGSAEQPASPQDIKNFKKALCKARRKGKDIVWHHGVEVLAIPDEFCGGSKECPDCGSPKIKKNKK